MSKSKKPSERDLSQFVELAKEFAPHMSLEQRKSIIAAVGNPQAVAAVSGAPVYEQGKRYRFHLTYQDVEHEVTAANETDARAMFNDAMKRWPIPKAVSCKLLGEVVEAESPLSDLPEPPADEAEQPQLPAPEVTETVAPVTT